MKLFIVADTYRDALRLASMLGMGNASGLYIGAWTYVAERSDIFRGYQNATLLVAPNAHRRRLDLGEIISTAEYRGFNILFVDEHSPKPQVSTTTVPRSAQEPWRP